MQRRSGKKLRTRSPTLTALTVFFLTLISISLASLLFYSLMMNTARTEFKQMAQIVSNATISSEKDQLLDVYAEFHKQNSDFVGWISLEGTSLDYPIMQTIDAPEYYLRRDFNKNYSLAGTPFLDARSDMENGNSLIVYGHNMNDGSMFGSLKKYKEEGFWKENQYFTVYSETTAYRYRIFSYEDAVNGGDVYKVGYQLGEEYQKFIDQMIKDSDVDTGVKPQTSNKILTNKA